MRVTTVYMDRDKTVTANFNLTSTPCSRDDPDEEEDSGANPPVDSEGGVVRCAGTDHALAGARKRKRRRTAQRSDGREASHE